MNDDLISVATRNRFREAFVEEFVLRDIETFFEEAGFSPDLEYIPPQSGARRSLVEQYYRNIDFRSPIDIENLLLVYAEVVSQLQRGNRDCSNLLERMKQDGYLYEDRQFRPVAGKRVPNMSELLNHAETLNLTEVFTHIERINRGVADDPPLAIGESKNLIESGCKFILDQREVPLHNDELPKLMRGTLSELALLPKNIPESAKGNDTIKRVLNSLTQVVQGLAELRNLYGSGHGHGPNGPGVQHRHARLCVGAAVTLAVFLLDTHTERLKSHSESD